MNAAGSGPSPIRAEREGEEREELTRLLPPPPERDVPPGRHSHHKDRLMQLIDDDQSRTTSGQASGEDPQTKQPRLRLSRPALWMPAAALALAGALTVGLVTRADSGNGVEKPGGDSAVVLLDRIAEVAAKSEVTPVRDDQLVYVRSLEAGAECQEDGPCEPGRLSEREAWLSQEPGPVKKLAEFYENGDYVPLRELLPPGSPGTPAGVGRPTYKWLASLPTDPDELLEELYRLAKPVKGEEKAQAVFDEIGELLNASVMPPRTAAALYGAAAKIPGVERVEDAVDPASPARGRHHPRRQAGVVGHRVDLRP